jgi:hypothetical protein
MPDLDDPDGDHLVLDRIHDPVSALTDAIPIPAGQLLAARGPWVFRQPLDAAKDPPEIFLGYVSEVLLDAFPKADPICGHLVSVS